MADFSTWIAPMTSFRSPRRLPGRLLATALIVIGLLAANLLPSLAQDASPTPGGAAVTGENIEISTPQKLGGTFNFGINQDVGTFDPIQPMSTRWYQVVYRDPVVLGGTRHLSAAQFARDQRDALRSPKLRLP